MKGFEIRKDVRKMYTKEAFIEKCSIVFEETEGCTVVVPGIGNVTLFENPLIGFAAADDPLFEEYLKPEIIGPGYYTPLKWLPSAGTVVSFFLPFTEKVRSSNRADASDPSQEWLYGRIEGQAFISRYMKNLKQVLCDQGIMTCVPSLDERFGIQFVPISEKGISDFRASSRWSERHAAYACGLGTFGLSRGFITEKGMAGRLASIIVSEKWQADERNYTGVYDYCIRCGACAAKCPAHAISPEKGKNNILCNEHLESMKLKYAPRYGCGKCQVGVPCEFRAPGRNKKEIS